MTLDNGGNILQIGRGLEKRKGSNTRWVKNVALIYGVCFSAPLVDSNSLPSGSAMLMLLSVVFVGLAAFFIYKFKRCFHSDKEVHFVELT